MNEKELLQKIKEDAGCVTPPDSLNPEAVEQRLRGQAGKTAQAEEPSATAGRRNRIADIRSRQRRRRIIQFGSIAAVFVLALTAYTQAERFSGSEQKLSAVQTEHPAKMRQNAADTGAGNGNNDSGTMPESAAPEQTTEAEASEKTILKTERQTEKNVPAEALSYASSYEEVYQALYEQFGQNTLYRNYDSQAMPIMEMAGGDMAMAAVEDGAVSSADTGTGAGFSDADTGAGTDFSETNIQEAGVDEADIVKTDGTYIYILRQDGTFAIVEAAGKDSRLLSLTAVDGTQDASMHELYLDGDTLYLIASCYASSLASEDDVYYTRSGRETTLYTYDISDRSAPALTASVTQDGAYEDSRKNGSFLYLFTSYDPTIADTYEKSRIAPLIGGAQAEAGDIYLPESLSDLACLVISSVDASAPDQVFDSKVLVSGASTYYVSPENIYMANLRYDSSSPLTELVKFHYENGTITGIASGTVPGYLNNSFSLNEYNGNLRIVTTRQGDEYNAVRDFVGELTDTSYEQNWTEHNALYVLDESLRQIGAIEGLAEGETIRSARFLGDTGYFVTFRQTDPLFSVDLSDPSNPQVLGALKISGFSSYLHFYGENRLLGIGYEADEETGVTTGLKLSMFDISDPANVQEIQRFVLPGITWCPAIEDYKSILVSPEKNLIGFFCDDRYLTFSCDEETGFTRVLLYDFYEDMLTEQAEYNNLRGLYIGDDFYLAGDEFVISFDMKNGFEKTGVLSIG